MANSMWQVLPVARSAMSSVLYSLCQQLDKLSPGHRGGVHTVATVPSILGVPLMMLMTDFLHVSSTT